jgi:sigma-E factor negative regulatory protein RseB
MLVRPLSVLTLTCAALMLVTSAWGQGAASDATAQKRDVRAWLMRIHEAASHQNFQGTFVVSGGGNVASARMAHFCEGANQFERIESLDGQARNVFRHNDVVHTVWPASRIAVVEQRDLLNSFPALLQAGGDGIADWYDLQPQTEERVAGHEANVLIVRPKDAYRYGYRLWSDRATGLLLRVDVLGERGEVLETAAFSDIAIGIRPQPDSVLQPMRKLDGFRVLRPVMVPTRLEVEGWAMRQVAPGFRQVSCVNRQMDNPRDVEATGGARQVLQAIYADGMTYVSVFIEPFKPKRHAEPMLAAVGATQTLSMRQGDWWVTVVGDVPAATLRLFANGLERTK